MNDRSVLAANTGAIFASCLFGASVVATKSAVEEIPPFSLAFLRYGQGALLLFAVLLIHSNESIIPDRPALRSFAFLGLLLYALFPVLFNTAMSLTTASRGAVLLATMPLWSALLARQFGNEMLTRRQIGGVLVSIAGVAVVFAESGFILDGGRDVILGNMLMILVAAAGGLYGVVAKPVLRKHDAMTVTAFAMGMGAAALLFPALLEGMPSSVANASTNTLLLTLFLGIFGGAIGFWLITYALSKMSPTRAAIYINLNPIVATMLGALFLDEHLTKWFVAGFALVLLGLGLTNISPKKEPAANLARAA